MKKVRKVKCFSCGSEYDGSTNDSVTLQAGEYCVDLVKGIMFDSGDMDNTKENINYKKIMKDYDESSYTVFTCDKCEDECQAEVFFSDGNGSGSADEPDFIMKMIKNNEIDFGYSGDKNGKQIKKIKITTEYIKTMIPVWVNKNKENISMQFVPESRTELDFNIISNPKNWKRIIKQKEKNEIMRCFDNKEMDDQLRLYVYTNEEDTEILRYEINGE